MTQHYLILDGSYYCFYRYHALKQWWGFARKDDDLQDNHDAFLEKFREVFVQKLKELPKTLKLKNFTFILGKDRPRKDIWRMQLFPDYKASRDSHTDELLKKCFQLVYSEDLFQEGGIVKTVYHPHLEADDVIAILKTTIRNRDYKRPIYIITNDHDYLQLFDDNTYIYNLKGLNLRTKSKGNSKLDLQFKIFRGDNSDNISSVISKKIRDDKIIDLIYNKEKFDEFFKDNEKLKEIYDTNELLIDFNKIPQNIQDNVSKYIKFKIRI